MDESNSLFESLEMLSQPRRSVAPASMEMYDQDYAFILNRTQISGHRMGIIHVHGVHDRAQVFLDGELIDVLDRKGITGGVTINEQYQFDWDVFPLPMNDLSNLKFGTAQAVNFPAFVRDHFNVEEPADTFLSPRLDKGRRLAERIQPRPILGTRPAKDAVPSRAATKYRGERIDPL